MSPATTPFTQKSHVCSADKVLFLINEDSPRKVYINLLSLLQPAPSSLPHTQHPKNTKNIVSHPNPHLEYNNNNNADDSLLQFGTQSLLPAFTQRGACGCLSPEDSFT